MPPSGKLVIIAGCMTGYMLFHQFKHHLGYLKAWMGANKGNLAAGNITTIKTLGSSQLDMYCGQLAGDEILQQVGHCLAAEGITNVVQYQQWVRDGYKLCTLSDGSVFTLRHLNNAQPIHIHPARYAPQTARIKANALKTVVCLLMVYDNADVANIARLNEVRKQYLGLPPVAEKVGIGEIRRVAVLLGTG